MDKETEKQWMNLNTRLQQLLLEYRESKELNQKLKLLLGEEVNKNKVLTEKLEQANKEYTNYKAARILEVNNQDVRDTKATINRLIKEIERCIALLKT